MKKLVFIGLVILSCISCGTSGDVIPNVAVNFEASTTDPRLNALKTINGAVIVDGYGIAGLILFHKADGGYAAYDRCSSYQPQNHCAVTLDNPTLTATDPCSGIQILVNRWNAGKSACHTFVEVIYGNCTKF